MWLLFEFYLSTDIDNIICKKITGQLLICIDFLILLCIILVVLDEIVLFYDAISLLSIA